MVGLVKFVAVAVLVECSFCLAQKQSDFPAYSLNALLLIGTANKDTYPTIDEKYFVYNPPADDAREEKSERPKTISAGFHNPTLAISPESRKDIDDKMEKVGKGLCYGSIAAAIFMGADANLLCGVK